jgi:hypothetical protein
VKSNPVGIGKKAGLSSFTQKRLINVWSQVVLAMSYMPGLNFCVHPMVSPGMALVVRLEYIQMSTVARNTRQDIGMK